MIGQLVVKKIRAASLEDVIGKFRKVSQMQGLRERLPQRLVSTCFKTEFNRCVEHELLNRTLSRPLSNRTESGWFEIAPVCRTNDMRKAEAGTHQTLFEVLTSVSFSPISDIGHARRALTDSVRDFLVTGLGFRIGEIGITFFGGGRVLPGLRLPPDELWRQEWRRIGVPAEQLFPVRGPKNYLMFVGPGERCGPKCEVMYRSPGRGSTWCEIGTLILDAWQLQESAPRSFRPREASSVAAGAAYGLERILLAKLGGPNLAALPTAINLIDVVSRATQQPRKSAIFLRSESVALVDQVKTAIFLLADGVKPNKSARGRLLEIILRRIRRRCAVLCIDEWPNLINDMEDKILDAHGARYPRLLQHRRKLCAELKKIGWPSGWNPESYRIE